MTVKKGEFVKRRIMKRQRIITERTTAKAEPAE